jgi:hypothetical protein
MRVIFDEEDDQEQLEDALDDLEDAWMRHPTRACVSCSCLPGSSHHQISVHMRMHCACAQSHLRRALQHSQLLLHLSQSNCLLLRPDAPQLQSGQRRRAWLWGCSSSNSIQAQLMNIVWGPVVV